MITLRKLEMIKDGVAWIVLLYSVYYSIVALETQGLLQMIANPPRIWHRKRYRSIV